MCVLSINVPIRKRSGNLFNDPRNPNYCIIKIGQSTEKSPGHLMRLAVTQTPVKDDQLTLQRKISQVLI